MEKNLFLFDEVCSLLPRVGYLRVFHIFKSINISRFNLYKNSFYPMKTKTFNLLVLILLLLNAGCQRPWNDDGDDPEDETSPWEELNFSTLHPILNTYATPYELYVISVDEFARIDAEGKEIEKRLIPAPAGTFGTPVLSDNVLMRLVKVEEAGGAKPYVEFRLTKDVSEVRRIPIKGLIDSTETHIEIEYLGRQNGCFSDDGVYFLLPTTTFPNSYYSFFLFEIRLNQTSHEFVSVDMVRRIDVPDFPAADGGAQQLESMRYLDGAFYLSSKVGGFRITADGTAIKLFNHWTRDFFKNDGVLYCTGFNDEDFYFSLDVGHNWAQRDRKSVLKLVEAEGDYLFTQENTGSLFSTVDDNFEKKLKIVYDKNFPASGYEAYNSVEYFYNKYYINVMNKIYYAKEIKVKK